MATESDDPYADTQAWLRNLRHWRAQGCPVCNSYKIQKYDYQHGRYMVVCNGCGHVFFADNGQPS